MPSKNRQQTIGKRNRERAVEEKRRLKRERKEAERAERQAALEAGLPPPDPAAERAAAREAEHPEPDRVAVERSRLVEVRDGQDNSQLPRRVVRHAAERTGTHRRRAPVRAWATRRRCPRGPGAGP